MTKPGDTMAAEPIVYGASAPGDYARRPDYTCAQDWNAYTAQDHDTYRRLYDARAHSCSDWPAMPSSPPCPGWARDAFRGLDDISEHLHRATGWEMVGVPGLIPEVPFFTLLANRKFGDRLDPHARRV